MSHVFLLFGASKGIGAACAMALARKGATVCVAARNKEQLETLGTEMGGKADVYDADVADARSVQTAVDAVIEKHKQIDTVINFAAFTGPLDRPVWELPPSVASDVIATNLNGPANIARACLPPMLERNKGALFFATSYFGDNVNAGMGAYGAARAGAHMLVHQLAAELNGSGVGAALVYPGITATDGLEAFRKARGNALQNAQVETPERMASLFVWAAMQSPWDINGASLSWDNPQHREQALNTI
ncbi:hypothetical protein ACMU_12000 [Actibacterium mucosum KCTC 23349]|uniref:Short-chain dehydrogenase n=1 Tax=Actibacterium mucosum KCTC 23349 TaxID=1454373 RepID=A0A037ZIR6_9RHOB|nr:SDR family oxidoreductase [Actibacterium mucosum]KAJ55412.1 hypothetical protein ACMU_12000 [Actibacterium mucosum KCTC 23349]